MACQCRKISNVQDPNHLMQLVEQVCMNCHCFGASNNLDIGALETLDVALQVKSKFPRLNLDWSVYKMLHSTAEREPNNTDNMLKSLTIPGRRHRRKHCSERLDPAGRTRCAGCWGAARILGPNKPSWPWGRWSTSSAGSSGRPSRSAHRRRGRMDGWADSFRHIHLRTNLWL